MLHVHRLTVVIGLAALALASGCKRSSHASPERAAAPAASATAAEHHAASVDRLDRLAADDPTAAASMQTIAGRLRYELAHRPAVDLPVEAVFAALERAGLAVTDGPRQYVALAAGADYCAGGATADGLGVTVCEYTTPDRATAGKATVERRFAALAPVRDIVVRGRTTLTLTARPDAPLTDAKRRATAAFTTL